jgi:hypothetical protein
VIQGLEETLRQYHIELISVLLREIRIPEAVAKVIEGEADRRAAGAD